MVTLALFGLLAVLVAGVLFLAASYLLPAGEQIAPSIRDEPLWELPGERSLRSEDVAGVRLPVALRGYRFAETDLLLDRLGDELRARDEEIARLKGTDRLDRPDGLDAPVPPDGAADGEQLWGRDPAEPGATDELELPVGAEPEPPAHTEDEPSSAEQSIAEQSIAEQPEPAVEAEPPSPSPTTHDDDAR